MWGLCQPYSLEAGYEGEIKTIGDGEDSYYKESNYVNASVDPYWHCLMYLKNIKQGAWIGFTADFKVTGGTQANTDDCLTHITIVVGNDNKELCPSSISEQRNFGIYDRCDEECVRIDFRDRTNKKPGVQLSLSYRGRYMTT